MLALWWALVAHWCQLGRLVHFGSATDVGSVRERWLASISPLGEGCVPLQTRCEAARLPHANAVPARGAPAALRVSFQALR